MTHFQDTVLPNPTRFERSLHLSALLTLLLLLAGGGTAQAQDGRAILLKTRKAYQALNSYSGEAAVTLTIRTPQGTAFTGKSSSTMSFQRPNKIHLLVVSTHSSRNIYSDGTTLSTYDLATNHYHTVPMAGKQGDLLALLAREDVTSNLDPLYFLCGKSLPQELTNIQLKDAAAHLGDHPVYIIKGMIRTPAGTSNANITLGPTSSWTWWIDRRSYLIYQVETTTPNSTVGNFNGVLTIRHSVVKLQSNPVIPISEFDFIPPLNAVRKQPKR